MEASQIYFIISTAIFILAAFFTLRSIGKEQPLTVGGSLISVILQITFLVIYITLAQAQISAQIIIVGLLIGLAYGSATEIKSTGDKITGKRRKRFFIFWVASIVFNQIMAILGSGLGSIPTLLSTGTIVGSEGNILVRTMRAKSANTQSIKNKTQLNETFLLDETCGICEENLTWIPEYNRYYCYNCEEYPPTCPDCGKDLFWIPMYSEYYCNKCGKYAEILE